jgi:alkylation response protein AidB-like acyl-CoA dehydrogenase
MDFDLSADQMALRDAATSLLDDLSSPARVREVADSGSFDAVLWDAMVTQGWLGTMVPAEQGGLGLGAVEAALLLEQTGAHTTPVPLLQQLLALHATAGTTWTDRLLSGDVIAAATRLALDRAADGSVSGRTEPVIYGARAGLLVAPTTDCHLVAVDLGGVSRSPTAAMDLTRELAYIELDGVPATTVGDEAAADSYFDLGATFHAAEILGAAEVVMNLAVSYAKQRRQFGQPIGGFQAIKHRCADMLVDVEAMRGAVYYAAWAVGTGAADADMAASTAKAWCSDAGLRVAESALQIHGGIGFTWESDVHLYLKRIQLDGVAFGDARSHRKRLAGLLKDKLAAGEPIL